MVIIAAMNSMNMLRPTHIVKTVEGITPESLDENGLGLDRVGALAFDVDGTLMSHHETYVEHSVYKTLRGLADASYKLFIISNAYGERVDELRALFEYNGVGLKVISPEYVTPYGDNPKRYRKPKAIMLEAAVEESESVVAMVGDQMLKDVQSANRAGMPSILVPRRGDGDDPRVKYLQRPLELVARKQLALPNANDDYPDTLRIV